MELFRTSKYYIFRQGEYSLWCNRKTGQLEPKTAWDLTTADDPTCMGLVHGIIGKLNSFPDGDAQLLVIESCSLVGYVWNKLPVFKINKVGLLSLSLHEPEITTHPCSKHNISVAFNQSRSNEGSPNRHTPSKQQEALAKTWGSIKSATKSLKSSTVQAAHRMGIDARDGDRGTRKLWDEVEKIFSQPDSFYFSPGVDLTNSIPNLGEKYNLASQPWQSANSRFFWNEFLLKELIDLKDSKANPWIVPVLHGYVHIDSVPVEFDGVTDVNKPLTLMLISRRSRQRAGTRYKRRGVDDNGHVANYVETEQCLLFGSHILSFVQIRGSVPVFWSQPGFKYRPPPQIDRGMEDTQLAFQRHFKRELEIYGQQCIVSLVEQIGKEKIIGDAFTEHVVQLNDPRLTYVTFDFHEHCRGMRFENVLRLVNGLEELLQEMGYTWIDSHGAICQQKSTFRVNCMDCLDRTNVCQTAFGKFILERQLSKLGILPPEGSFWPMLKTSFNTMWANNGDVLSRQYAGTNALKGDFTRTGERRFAGMMKDGMNSANRYYMNRFKDTLKQTAIDLMLGNIHAEEALNLLHGQNNLLEDDEEVVLQTADRVRQVIDDCRKQFINPEEITVGSWGLVDAHPTTGDPMQVDMDVIVVLSREYLYVVSYDDDEDHVNECKKYNLSEITKLEVGSQLKTGLLSNAGVSFMKSPKREVSGAPSFLMRIHLENNILQFRSTKLRFFNNMAVPICKTEDMNESLKAIAETIHVTMEISGLSIPYVVGTLDKIVVPKAAVKVGHMELPLLQGFPRNASEGQLSAFRQAGNKALSSVTSHFSRLKPSAITRSTASSVKNKNSVTITTTDAIPSSYSSLNDLSSFEIVKDVLHVPSAGILFLTCSEIHVSRSPPLNPPEKPLQPKVLLRCVSAGQFDSRDLLGGKNNKHIRLIVTPDIQVSSVDGQTISEESNLSLKRLRQLSHSSECVELLTPEAAGMQRAASETSLGNTVNIDLKNSKSEQGLLPIGTNVKTPNKKFNVSDMLTSPTSMKGNPLLMFAKGVQNLGANLDPRKMLDAKRETTTSCTNKLKDEEEKVCSNTRIIRL